MIFIKLTPLMTTRKEKGLINAETIRSLYPHYTHSFEASEHDVCNGTQVDYLDGNHNVFKESIEEIHDLIGLSEIESVSFDGVPKIGDKKIYKK